MNTNHKDIPTLTTQTYKENYFKRSADNAAIYNSLNTKTGHFEIHRRDDYRYQCKEVIPSNRLDFFMVNLVTGGEGIKTFGAKEYYVKRGMLCFESPGKITSWQAKADRHEGYFCVFHADFFQQSSQVSELLNSYPFFQLDGCSALQLDEEETEYFNGLFKEMEKEYESDDLYKADVIRAFLTIILKKAQRLHISGNYQAALVNSNAGLRLTKAFTQLFEKDFESVKRNQQASLKNLSCYAGLLNVSKNHLINTVKSVSGKPPGLLIHERMVREVAQLLVHTELSIAEICYLFNFENPSYFTRFFKRYMDSTPSQYREKEKLVKMS
ncbi:AraC family transcriptional regulator [Pedobacter sp. L105]|uniref:helix-turn-helix domain-containing protein n=1 Tax=Pedobacter sp. L105 TaxID=1641871 RepID=UPI00131C4E6D|nr:helix-turn-helix domain-containing protein [Pedobacter sp. L105]